MIENNKRKLLHNWINGNYNVKIFSDGTKIRQFEDTPSPIWPESIDLKITDYCDMAKFCRWCHESSDRTGKQADLNWFLKELDNVPAGVEFAIGGGNPLSHPDLINFLIEMKSRGLVPNITINELHLRPFWNTITKLIDENLVYGIGVSYNGSNPEYLNKIKNLTNNVVVHVIAGVQTYTEISKLLNQKHHVLILGFKNYGRGSSYSDLRRDVDEKIYNIKWAMQTLIHRGNLSFDNLAIEQLNIADIVPINDWQLFYLGEEGKFSMYIDAVSKKVSQSSYIKGFDFIGIKESFNIITNQIK